VSSSEGSFHFGSLTRTIPTEKERPPPLPTPPPGSGQVLVLQELTMSRSRQMAISRDRYSIISSGPNMSSQTSSDNVPIHFPDRLEDSNIPDRKYVSISQRYHSFQIQEREIDRIPAFAELSSGPLFVVEVFHFGRNSILRTVITWGGENGELVDKCSAIAISYWASLQSYPR
jgi:hypothetical protein